MTIIESQTNGRWHTLQALDASPAELEPSLRAAGLQIADTRRVGAEQVIRVVPARGALAS